MEASDVLSGGNVEIREISTEMRSAYLDYAMSVIVPRTISVRRRSPVHLRRGQPTRYLRPRATGSPGGAEERQTVG
jgi:hypothetical protein